MLGLFNLGGGEIILILFLSLFLVAGPIAVLLIVLWLVARAKKPPRPVGSVQPTPPMPAPSRTCPRCGAPLPTGAPEGLCPRCVLGVGLATHTEAPGDFGPQGTKTLQPPPEPAEIAKHFPQLEILECLGRGGMGMVYKARQPKLNRLVALKILAPEKGADPKFAERFLREAQALARLSHPNIVMVHDFGEADGLYYLLMEYVDGVTLRQLLHGHKIAPEQALNIVPKICEALQFAHELGIVHRDIKPENVLLDKQGRVKIADFGIAKLVGAEATGPSLTEEQSVIGTPHYMAPEQVEKPQTVDHRADIYSLGVVFYEMLTGELPLGNFQPPSRKVQVDVRLDEVVLHALEKEPERRYQHASDVNTDLQAIAATPGAPAAARKPAAPVHVKRWRDCWPWDNVCFSLSLAAPPIVAGLLLPICLHWWGLKALWLFALEVPGATYAAVYGVVGYRIRRLKAALPRPTGEVAECLMFRVPFQTAGLAVLHDDRLELIPITGSPITVVLEDIAAVSEVRWFNGTRLWWKQGFVMELANGQRVGVAVAEWFARRWRSRLSRGSLPEIEPDSGSATGTPQTGTADRASARPARFSRMAIWGAVWAPLFFLVGVTVFMPFQVTVAPDSAPPGPAWWQIVLSVTLLPLGLTAPFGTSVLGWIAISQIRHSQGRLHGLGLAVFDGLLFPLLALDALICGVLYLLARATWSSLALVPPGNIFQGGFETEASLLGACVIMTIVAVIDFYIVRRVWRAVIKPPGNGQPGCGPRTVVSAASS